MSIKSLQILSEFYLLLSPNKKTINPPDILSLHKYINTKLEKISTLIPPKKSINSIKEISILKNNMNNFINDFLKYLHNKSMIKINKNIKSKKIIKNNINNNLIFNKLKIVNNIYEDYLLNNNLNFEIDSYTFINFFNESGNEKYISYINLFMNISKYLIKNKLIYKRIKLSSTKDDFNNSLNKNQKIIYIKPKGIICFNKKKEFLTPPKINHKLNKFNEFTFKEKNNIENISDIETMRIKIPKITNFSQKLKKIKTDVNVDKYLNTAQKVKIFIKNKNKFSELNKENDYEMIGKNKIISKTIENNDINESNISNIIKIGKNIKKDYKHSMNIYD